MATYETFSQLSSQLKYKEQAIFFLNGFWQDSNVQGDAEKLWKFVKDFIDLDNKQIPPKGAEGNELDKLNAARMIEMNEDEAMTAQERTEAFRVIDHDNNGKMSLMEYLVWRYKKTPAATLKSSQGENTAALDAAQAKMDAVAEALADLAPKVEASKLAAEEARIAEDNVKQAEAELQAAIAELNAIEAALKEKAEKLEATSNDESLGVVKRNKAANELEQMKAEDPLPLRKAKITQEAALKKVTKQLVIAEAATATAEATAAELEKAFVQLEEKMSEAAAELEEIKKNGGPAMGNFWWMGRELFEADKSLPRSKQKYDHSKPFVFVE